MARYDAKRNKDHNNFGLIDGGLRHGFTGYSARATALSYEATQQEVHYSGFPMRANPKNVDLIKNIQGVLENHNPLLLAWGPTHHDRLKKDNESYGTNGSPWDKIHRDNSPPSRDHHYGTYENFSSDESDDDEKNVICDNGFCVPKPKHVEEEDYEREKPKGYPHSVPNSTHQKLKTPYNEKARGDGHNPLSYTVPVSTPPKKDPYHESSYNEKPKGNTYSNGRLSYTVPESTQPKKDPYPHDTYNEKPKGNTYNPPSYTVPRTTQPRKDPYNETSYNSPDTYYEKPKDSTYSPPSYIVPRTTQPRKDSYHETPYNPPPNTVPHTTQPVIEPNHEASTNRPMMYSYPLSHIKTNTSKGPDYLGESTRNSPVSVGAQRLPFSTSSPRSPFTSSPRKEHETIDSREAQRRYGKAASPRIVAPTEQYESVIDSQAAARKYNGVFVNFP